MKYLTKGKHKLHFYLSSQNKIILILISSLYFGIICGSIMPRITNQIHTVLIGYTQSITSSAPPGHILLNDFIICFILFCSLFLLGMSVYGYVLIPIFPFFKGIAYGFSSSFLYAVFGARGIIICALAIMPQAILSSVFLITGCYFSFTKSRSFQARNQHPGTGRADAKHYRLIFLILFSASFLLVIFDLFCMTPVIQLFC